MIGREYISEEIKVKQKTSFDAGAKLKAPLTKREIEILTYISQGLTNFEIGLKLFISDRTIDTHRTNLMRKINVKNIAGLVRFAFSSKLLN